MVKKHSFNLNDKVILITGGTGSFGKRFVENLLQNFPRIKKIIIYSRDELKQLELKNKYPNKFYPKFRFFIGDVRDTERLKLACSGVNVIIHAAALKQVDTAEYNPTECIATNITGAENVIKAALANKVERVVALSTDKACSPNSLYGATKLVSDKLFIAANNIRGELTTSFSVVRYGNVMCSRGSVIPFFHDLNSKSEVIPITDMEMTRFNITLDEGVSIVIKSLSYMLGGEIFVPKIPSYSIKTVLEAIAPKAEYKIIGLRPGEKIHEEMISVTEAFTTLECNDYFVILPAVSFNVKFEDYQKFHKGKKLPKGSNYSSNLNDHWETVETLRKRAYNELDNN
ncbi:UDP-N-acetylglucosamine 4,6-dehydratase (inverting) [Alphaproteobacteria bacterium]|nr:UDP-N-acetylglucosamine 4,6-dehydratase (inverting) [Alphaproteobacteria bacterium]